MGGRAQWVGLAATAVAVAAIGTAALAGGRTIDGAGGPPDEPAAATVAGIYVVALTGRPGPLQLTSPVYIHDRVCPLVPDRPGVPCDGEVIPAEVQDAVTDALGTQAHFVADPPPVGERGPTVYDIGELTVLDTHATIDVQSQCGPLCGSGETLSLVRADGRWTITDRTTHWIS